MPETTPNANVARHLALMAAAQPGAPALKVPRGRDSAGNIDYLALSFRELAAEANAWTARLQARGVRRGDRTLVMVRPGLPLIAAVFGLFQLGAVPVVIDPGMGLRGFLGCVARSRPRALVGIPLARIVRQVFRGAFRTVGISVPASGSLTARLADPAAVPDPGLPIALSGPEELAAVLFTSGSTGAPKGVAYEHGMFEAQVSAIRAAYDIRPGEIDLPMLPIFSLFNPALGMTTIVPEIDPRRPARADPARLVRAIRQERVTNSFGSPMLWRKILDHCARQGLTLPTLRRVLCAGAPVDPPLYALSQRILTGGELHSPYGATEALPVSSASAREVLAPAVAAATLRRGAYVGRAIPGVEIRVIALKDAPIATIGEARPLPPGELGEIIVRGAAVTRLYDNAPEATALAKIAGAEPGAVWHRMGDCGSLDADGGLWFAGRKAERVETAGGILFTDPCEQVFRQALPGCRCALVGLGPRGRQEPALVLEEEPAGAAAMAARRAELRRIADTQPHTAGIRHFFFHPRFPVDTRHNAKIHRLTLAQWAAAQRGAARA